MSYAGGFGSASSGAAVGAAAGSAIPFVGTAAGGLIGSIVGGLSGPKRLTSGVKQNVYNDEISDSRMVNAINSGVLGMRQFIDGTMKAPAGTPWGTAYSPEAIAWAEQKLLQMTGSRAPTPIPQASLSQSVTDQVGAALRQAVMDGTIPPDSAAAIRDAATNVANYAGAAQVTGTIRSSTGMSPTALLVVVGLGAFLLLRRR